MKRMMKMETTTATRATIIERPQFCYVCISAKLPRLPLFATNQPPILSCVPQAKDVHFEQL